jgi:hypothetical protein
MVLGIRERTGRSVTPKTDRTTVEHSIIAEYHLKQQLLLSSTARELLSLLQ